MAHTSAIESTLTGRTRNTRTRRDVRNVALWAIQIIAAGMFLMAGFFKLAGAPPAVAMFETIGIGQWFRYVTGVVELSGAILLLVPALSGAGAILLGTVMIGAVGAELFILGGNPAPALFLLTLASTIAYGRRDRTARLLRR